mgnify:CR=1 FL=1
MNFYSIGPVTPQLLVEEFFFTPDQPVEQRMEAGGMVVVDGVAEFVEDDEVAQMFGQRHQVQAQRQVVAPVAGAPFGAGGPDRYRTVLQTGSHCEFRDGSTTIASRRNCSRRRSSSSGERVGRGGCWASRSAIRSLAV